MFAKFLMKNPIFAIGVILFGLFVYDLYNRKPTLFRTSRTATSCKALLKPLYSKSPDSWEYSCQENNLVLTIDSKANKTNRSQLKSILYRELANHMTFVAKQAPNETLERVFRVKIKLIHPLITIEALADGTNVAKLATITNKKFIAQHLKSTVEVLETIPESEQTKTN